jgi:hypothetical protein
MLVGCKPPHGSEVPGHTGSVGGEIRQSLAGTTSDMNPRTFVLSVVRECVSPLEAQTSILAKKNFTGNKIVCIFHGLMGTI